jgi:hypothetical protein
MKRSATLTSAIGSVVRFYPGLFAIAFVLDEAVSNGVALSAGFRAIPVAFFGAIVIVVIGLLITRHAGRGPFLAMAAILALLAGDGPLPLLFSAAILIILYVDLRLTRIGRSSVPWPDVNRGLTAMGLALVLVVWLPSFTPAQLVASPAVPGLVAPGAIARPDIYLVLLDGLGRPDVLADHYGQDSTGFVAELEQRGFTIATKSRSNHATTGLAITTMLNAKHVTDLGFSPTGSLDARELSPALQHNRAFSFLAAAGYETIAVSSGYELVSLRSADRFIDTGELNELELGVIGQTALEPAINAVVGDLKSDQIRARALAMVPAVQALAAEPESKPRLVFLHFPLPHPPFVLDRDCNPILGGESIYIVGADGTPRKPPERIAYETALTAGQVTCVEQLAVQMVDGILAGASSSAVVIVFSDHGPETRLDWFAPEPEPIRERIANFFAARTPGHPGLFPDDITLVNVLPDLFRPYFGVDLGQQLDTSYFKMPGVGLVDVEAIGR